VTIFGKGIGEDVNVEQKILESERFTDINTYAYVVDYVKVLKQTVQITGYPDNRNAVKQTEKDYVGIYGYSDYASPHPYVGHKGTDYGVGVRTNVYGLDGFKVNEIGYNNSRGNYIEIGNSKIAFIFMHLSAIYVTNNTNVSAQTVLGRTGNIGLSSGPHLHVQTWLGAVSGWVDSTPYMAGRKSIPGNEVPKDETTKNIIKKGRYVYYLKKDGTIDYAEGRTAGVVRDIYKYYPGVKYGHHNNKEQYIYWLNRDGTLDYANGYERGTFRKTDIYKYYPGVTYGRHVNKEKYIYELAGDGTLLRAVEYDEQFKQIRQYGFEDGTFFNKDGAHWLYKKFNVEIEGSIG
jgi:murein DD-endopeptidase MepM/ murein hydrolase activator NlpD